MADSISVNATKDGVLSPLINRLSVPEVYINANDNGYNIISNAQPIELVVSPVEEIFSDELNVLINLGNVLNFDRVSLLEKKSLRVSKGESFTIDKTLNGIKEVLIIDSKSPFDLSPLFTSGKEGDDSISSDDKCSSPDNSLDGVFIVNGLPLCSDGSLNTSVSPLNRFDLSFNGGEGNADFLNVSKDDFSLNCGGIDYLIDEVVLPGEENGLEKKFSLLLQNVTPEGSQCTLTLDKYHNIVNSNTDKLIPSFNATFLIEKVSTDVNVK
jgi:hypothetical protein